MSLSTASLAYPQRAVDFFYLNKAKSSFEIPSAKSLEVTPLTLSKALFTIAALQI